MIWESIYINDILSVSQWQFHFNYAEAMELIPNNEALIWGIRDKDIQLYSKSLFPIFSFKDMLLNESTWFEDPEKRENFIKKFLWLCGLSNFCPLYNHIPIIYISIAPSEQNPKTLQKERAKDVNFCEP